jgi:hypothetical protein
MVLPLEARDGWPDWPRIGGIGEHHVLDTVVADVL